MIIRHSMVVRFAIVMLLMLALATPAFAAGSLQQGDDQNQQGQAQQGQGTCITNQQAQGARLTGNQNWQMLCGQPAVFSFQYPGNDEEVTIEVATDPQNAASLQIFTEQEWNDSGMDGDPFGQGTQAEERGDNLLWRGGSPNGGTYFVVVRPNTQQNTAFWIEKQGAGSDLQFAGAMGQQQAQPQTQQQAQAQPTQQAQAQQQGPQTLPVTGGPGLGGILLGAGSALLAAGWLARRRFT